MISSQRTKRYLSLLLLGIVLTALAARLVPGPRTIDDSFITFRYAKNILAGNGFAYNPGEHVLGTTTPLYTILLTILAAPLGGANAPFPQIALVVNALADAVTCLLLFQLGRRLGSVWAGLGAAIVWSIAPFSVTFAVGGLETSLYVLLLTATACAHVHQRNLPAALLGGMALLTRPDALILLGPIFLDRSFQVWREISEKSKEIGEKGKRGAGERRQSTSLGSRGAGVLGSKRASPLFPFSPLPLYELLTFLVPVLAWIGFATAYFGSPLPHSITAKSLAYRLPETAALVRLLQHYATPFQEHLTFGVPAIALGLVLYPFLFIIGARRSIQANPRTWPWLAYPWLYFAAFALAHPLIFRWYLTPPLPAYILGILIGVEGILKSLPIFRPTPPIPPSLPGTGGEGGLGLARAVFPLFFIVLAPLSLSLRDWQVRPGHGLERPAPEIAWYQLELLYRQAAGTLAPRLAPDPGSQVLAAGDVGVLGYYTGARILDTVGLNSPQALGYYPLDPDLYTINYAVSPDLINDLQPDFVVILEVYGRKGLLQDPQFQQGYALVDQIPTDIYGSEGMLIFERIGNRGKGE